MIEKIIGIGRFGLNIIYSFLKLLPTKKKITFISRQSNEPSMEFQMVKEEIECRKDGTEVIMLCKTLDGGVNSSLKNKILYGLHMFVQMYHLATSKVVILDSYCIVASLLKHKKELKIVQMWHSIGSMKLFGYTALGKAEGSSYKLAHAMKMHANYDYIFAAGEAYKEHLANGFHCDIDKVIVMPLPRVDVLKSKVYESTVKTKIYDMYPELNDGKEIIVYCPTFRKDEKDFARAVNALCEAVNSDKYHLVVKMHPLSKVELPDTVVQAKSFSSFDMLFVADYVISDYSCIVYEAAIRMIPIYFYNFDMDLYVEGRGFAIDYENELPGLISKEAELIMKAIQNGAYDVEELKAFSERYVKPVENATKNIVDFVFDLMEERK